MVYAKASLGPTRLGSTVTAVDDSLAREVPGYIRCLVLSTRGLPGMGVTEVALVIARSYPAALRAEKALKVDWQTPAENLLDESDLWSEERLADSRGAQQLARTIRVRRVQNIDDRARSLGAAQCFGATDKRDVPHLFWAPDGRLSDRVHR